VQVRHAAGMPCTEPAWHGTAACRAQKPHPRQTVSFNLCPAPPSPPPPAPQFELELATAEAQSAAAGTSGARCSQRTRSVALVEECAAREAHQEPDGRPQTDLLASGASKATLRHEARCRREAQWAALRSARPDPAVDAPEDAEALRVAAATIGDLHLRSAPGYVPAEVGREAHRAGRGSRQHSAVRCLQCRVAGRPCTSHVFG
jgi:hypothetical protein